MPPPLDRVNNFTDFTHSMLENNALPHGMHAIKATSHRTSPKSFTSSTICLVALMRGCFSYLGSYPFLRLFPNIINFRCTEGYCTKKLSQQLCRVEQYNPLFLIVIFYRRLSSIKGRLQSKGIFHQMLSSIKVCLP